MRTRIVWAAATACVVLLLSAGMAFGHEAHKKEAERASAQTPPSELAPPAPSLEPESKPHDHSDHAPSHSEAEPAGEVAESNVPKPLAWLGKFHPPVTHFPVALLIAAALAELLFMRTGRVLFEHSVRFCVWVGALGALAAAPLGWFFAGFHIVDKEWVMTAHRWAGTSTALFALALFYLVEQAGSGKVRRQSFRVALFMASALVGGTGFLGGALIYGLDHYAWWE